MKESIPLTELKNGDSGTVVDIQGGEDIHRRLTGFLQPALS